MQRESSRRRVRVKVDRNGQDILSIDDYKDSDGRLIDFTVIVRDGRRSAKDTGDKRVVRRGGHSLEDKRRDDRRGHIDERRDQGDERRVHRDLRDRLDLRSTDSRRLDAGRHRRDSDILAKREAVLSAIVNKSIHERLICLSYARVVTSYYWQVSLIVRVLLARGNTVANFI